MALFYNFALIKPSFYEIFLLDYLLCMALLYLVHARTCTDWLSWTKKVPITVTNTGSVTLTNYQELLIINTQTHVSAGDMDVAGNDIRFADSCASTLMEYWIEDAMNTDSTKIWVVIPSLQPGETTGFFMYFGNPNTVAGSSFFNVFTSAYIFFRKYLNERDTEL